MSRVIQWAPPRGGGAQRLQQEEGVWTRSPPPHPRPVPSAEVGPRLLRGGLQQVAGPPHPPRMAGVGSLSPPVLTLGVQQYGETT